MENVHNTKKKISYYFSHARDDELTMYNKLTDKLLFLPFFPSTIPFFMETRWQWHDASNDAPRGLHRPKRILRIADKIATTRERSMQFPYAKKVSYVILCIQQNIAYRNCIQIHQPKAIAFTCSHDIAFRVCLRATITYVQMYLFT